MTYGLYLVLGMALSICGMPILVYPDSVGAPWQGHSEEWVASVAFSSDDTCVVLSSQDHTLRIWNVDTGELARDPLRRHSTAVISFVRSSDGRTLRQPNGTIPYAFGICRPASL